MELGPESNKNSKSTVNDPSGKEHSRVEIKSPVGKNASSNTGQVSISYETVRLRKFTKQIAGVDHTTIL